MHDDDLLALLMQLRAELRPEAPAFQRIVGNFKLVWLQLEGERFNLPSSNRHLLDAVCDWLKMALDELDEPSPAELSEQPAQVTASGDHSESHLRPAEQPPSSMLTETPAAGEDGTDPEDRIRDALCMIWVDLRADPAAHRYLRELGDPPAGADALWTELHLASWRLPQAESQVWRDRLREALVDVLGADAAPAPSELDARVVPAVDWQGVLARDTHRIANADESQQWVRGRLGDKADRFPELISAVAHVLTLLSAGDNRRMIWRKRHMGDRKLESDQTLMDYHNELKVELESLGKQQPESTEELEALVNIDELVRSVTHDPLPAPDSGWVRNVERLLEWLRSKAERADAKVEELTGTYNGCRGRTKDNVRASELQEGDPGQVLWTLRTSSFIAGDLSRGRVIYVPTR